MCATLEEGQATILRVENGRAAKHVHQSNAAAMTTTYRVYRKRPILLANTNMAA